MPPPDGLVYNHLSENRLYKLVYTVGKFKKRIPPLQNSGPATVLDRIAPERLILDTKYWSLRHGVILSFSVNT